MHHYGIFVVQSRKIEFQLFHLGMDVNKCTTLQYKMIVEVLWCNTWTMIGHMLFAWEAVDFSNEYKSFDFVNKSVIVYWLD